MSNLESIDGYNQLIEKTTRNCVYSDENFDIYCNKEIDIKPIVDKVVYKLENLARKMNFELKRKITVSIVDDRKDFLLLNKSFYWCTGLSTGDNIFIIHPDDYKGNLYNNVFLHECIHCLIYQIFGEERSNLKYEEGFAVLFSTPLLDWKRELMKEENLYYLFEAEFLQKVYSEKGMNGVLEVMSEDLKLNEDSVIIDNEKKYPIYIFTLCGDSMIAKAIRIATKSPFTHACLSLDLTMNNLLTYNIRKKEDSKNNGFAIESLFDYKRDFNNDNFKFKVNVCFISERIYREIKNRVEFYKSHKSLTKYNIGQLFTILVNKTVKCNDYKLVCSVFVANLLEYCGIKILDKNPSLVTPDDLANAVDNKRIFTLYDGDCRNYNVNQVKGKLRSIMNKSEFIAAESSNIM